MSKKLAKVVKIFFSNIEIRNYTLFISEIKRTERSVLEILNLGASERTKPERIFAIDLHTCGKK